MANDVNNQKEFYENIVLDNDGNVEVVQDNTVKAGTKSLNQYDFFKRIILTNEGYLQINVVA